MSGKWVPSFSYLRKLSLNVHGAWNILTPVFIRVSVAVMKHQDQSNLRRNGFCGLHFHSAVSHQRKSRQELKQGRNLEAEAHAEAMKGCCLLACFLWLTQLAIL